MAGEAEVSAVLKTSEMGLKALLELLKMLHTAISKSKYKSAMNSAQEDIGTGKVSQSDLMKEAHRKNYTVAAQDGITKSDMRDIARLAKDYGIPVSFTGKKDLDNIKVSFRDSDKAVFSQIMTDIVKEKLETKPHELMSFKIENANVPHFKEVLKQNDLTADFIVDEKGGIHCIHEIADKKAFEMVKREFKNIHDEIAENFNVTKEKSEYFWVDDNGVAHDADEYIIVKYGETEISFSQTNTPDYETVRKQIQDNYGFDDVETGLAIAKIADSLPPVYQRKLLDTNPLNQVKAFESNIRLKGESILIMPYEFYRINTKNGLEALMVQDEKGRTATLIPEIMTEKQLRGMIETRLGVADKDTVDALVEKAETLNSIYRKIAKDNEQNYSHGTLDIKKSESGKFFKVSNERQTQLAAELSGSVRFEDMTSLMKSYSIDDQKASIEAIQKDFSVSKEDAQEIFRKAKSQRIISETKEELLIKSEIKEQPLERSPQVHDEGEVTVKVERKVGGTFTVTRGDEVHDYSLNEAEKTRIEMKKDFDGISDEDIDSILEEANSQTSFREPPSEKMVAVLSNKGFKDVKEWTFDEAFDMVERVEKNGWNAPNGINPAEYVPESIRNTSHQKIDLDKNSFKLTDVIEDTPSFGGKSH